MVFRPYGLIRLARAKEPLTAASRGLFGDEAFPLPHMPLGSSGKIYHVAVLHVEVIVRFYWFCAD